MDSTAHTHQMRSSVNYPCRLIDIITKVPRMEAKEEKKNYAPPPPCKQFPLPYIVFPKILKDIAENTGLRGRE